VLTHVLTHDNLTTGAVAPTIGPSDLGLRQLTEVCGGNDDSQPRSVADLNHGELATLVREHLLAGHVIDRAGMPVVIPFGIDVMRDVAIDEWMGASPVYAKRMQKLLGFEGDTVEVALKGFQLDIGSPLEFMDFRLAVQDDQHGTFHLDHCGALMDVEPMGDDYVVAMCHHIEDPTFDATGWATNPCMRMRPLHRPPRVPADRHPHCSWTVEIDESLEPTPTPERAVDVAASEAAGVPLPTISGPLDDGFVDYTRPLDPDLRHEDFATGTLRAIIDEIDLQGHLLAQSFARAVADRLTLDQTRDAVTRQFIGVAGWAAERLVKAFELATDPIDVATVFELHPAFRPRTYVNWSVEIAGDGVHLRLGDCPALQEFDVPTWISELQAGRTEPLSAIATAVDPYFAVNAVEPGHWVVARSGVRSAELPEVSITRFSTATKFRFTE